MSDFERVKLYYEKKWASVEQVGKYVEFEKITPEEYKLITGLEYTPQ
ncbi:XkdX family protein [Heyndrickxia oleronia]|nr:XkdX family protein [Heyndrickxia oleronia]GIN38375.1 hypothetical protein J19TS1_13240 [Heyndrickxia oleronia]